MRRFARAGLALLVASTALLGGCHTFRPPSARGPERRDAVRLRFTAPRPLTLESADGQDRLTLARVTMLRGRLIRFSVDTMTIALDEVGVVGGASWVGGPWRVRVVPDRATAVDVGVFSIKRTLLFLLGVLFVIANSVPS